MQSWKHPCSSLFHYISYLNLKKKKKEVCSAIIHVCNLVFIAPHDTHLDIFSILFCKTCMVIGCEQPFSSPATRYCVSSGFCLSCSTTFTLLSLNRFLRLTLWSLGHCLTGKWIYCRVVVLLHTESGCPPDLPYTWPHSFYPLPLQAFQGLLQRSIPTAWCCLHHASWRRKCVCVFLHSQFVRGRPALCRFRI